MLFDINLKMEAQTMNRKNVEHWPTLNTVLMVEDTLRKMEGSVMKISELKRKLPKQVNHNTLMVILQYLEISGKIVFSSKGITWVYTDRSVIEALIKKGTEV